MHREKNDSSLSFEVQIRFLRKHGAITIPMTIAAEHNLRESPSFSAQPSQSDGQLRIFGTDVKGARCTDVGNKDYAIGMT